MESRSWASLRKGLDFWGIRNPAGEAEGVSDPEAARTQEAFDNHENGTGLCRFIRHNPCTVFSMFVFGYQYGMMPDGIRGEGREGVG